MKLTKAQHSRREDLARKYSSHFQWDDKSLYLIVEGAVEAGYQAGLNDPSVEGLVDALSNWQGWAETMVDENVLDSNLVGEYWEAKQALKEFGGE